MKIIICHLVFLFSALSYAADDDYYNFKWLSTDKNIFVLQQKFFEKKRTFFFNAGVGKNSTSDFQDSSTLHLSSGFFFSETWGIEGFVNSYSNSNNETYEKVSATGRTVPNIRRFNRVMGANLLYSPFYGKLNTFNKILYMELIVGLGLSSISSENNIESFEQFDPSIDFESESLTGFQHKIQLRLNVTKKWLFNVEYYSYYFSAANRSNEQESLQSASDFIISTGFSL